MAKTIIFEYNKKITIQEKIVQHKKNIRFNIQPVLFQEDTLVELKTNRYLKTRHGSREGMDFVVAG
jgi:hypothetical protein